MIRYVCNRMLLAMQRRYDYDVSYLQEILQADLRAFLKFMAFQTMASHRGNLPVEALFAAKLRAIIWDDCGPCTQLVVNMALEAEVEPDLVRAIVDRDLASLPAEIGLVVQFTEFALAHDPRADELREKIIALWGNQGLITLGYSISSSRVYPALKYALGHGQACSRVQVNDYSLAPKREPAFAEGGSGV